MRLSRVQLLGFKSFAAKTELRLDPGITAIVGPNGCGKSNVIDAVKWVLGEQRPSSLRAKEMMDVIFAGSDRRRPLGMAEVSLVLDNSDGGPKVKDLEGVERTEIVFTRRLYRSGESEYRMNGRVCRLKDLRETLMDTGSGLDALSIMEQGRIDAILTANPVERRAVFEEAAGIGRFKARRKETTRRLERIADDLTRLRDVIEITEKQLRSLRYQASRARKFREYSEDLKKKRVTWALYRYHALLTERSGVTEKLRQIGAEEELANQALQALLVSLSDEETEVERAGTMLSEAETALFGVDAEIRSAREGGEHARRMVAELAGRVEWYDGEIKVTRRRSEDMAEEQGTLADESAALAAEAALRETEVERAEEAIAAARRVERECEEELAKLKDQRLEAISRRTRLRNERVSLGSVIGSGAAIAERIERRRSAIAADVVRVRAEEGLAEKLLERARAGAEEARSRLAGVEDEAAALEARRRDLSRQAAESDRGLAAKSSRLEVLRSLKERHEGMGTAVQSVLTEAARAEGCVRGVRGVVADLIEVERTDAQAVELALGACAQGIVTETLEDALGAISWLKENELGRALFIPLSEVREAGPTYVGNGVARQAAGSVRVGGEYQTLVSALLSDSILVEDVDRAVTVAREKGQALRIVTGGGEVMNRIGAISGGRGRSTVSLLSRNAEIESLDTEVTAERERREAMEEAMVGLVGGIARLGGRVRELRQAAGEAEQKLREAVTGRDRLRSEGRRLAEEDALLEIERGEVDEEGREARAKDEELAAVEKRLDSEEGELGADFEEHEAGLSAARENSRELSEQRGEVRVVLASARERVAAAQARLTALAQGIADAARNVELASVELTNCEQRREESALEVEVCDQRVTDGEARREKLLVKVADRKRVHEEVRGRILSRREEAESLREQHDRHRTALEEYRLKESEVRTRVEGLLERVSEEFELNLPELYEEFEPEDVDWEALDTEVSDLRGKIDRMGNVNLEALDQLQEVEERVEFLRSEETDLLTSRESLLEILRKVNRESRQRFEKSFAEIKSHFRGMFRKLFGGGHAEIRLEEGADILEAGIEIVVRPPGRELQNLNLLSGGEKTLTAVALLFAIFKARPSPFALMDEVDAALDESNIDRFLSVLREFVDQSQFIIITHNKRTMAFADALYGVSMPEAGVSQQVSMRFSKDQQDPEPVPA